MNRLNSIFAAPSSTSASSLLRTLALPALLVTMCGVASAQATQLVFSTAPAASIASGQNGGFVGISEEDANGNVVTNNGDTITLVVSYTNQATTTAVTTTLTASTVNGTALFDMTPYPVYDKAATHGSSYTVTYAASGKHGTTTLTPPSTFNESLLSVPVWLVTTGTDDVGSGNGTGDKTQCPDVNQGTVTGGTTCAFRDAWNAINNATLTGGVTSSTINFSASVPQSTLAQTDTSTLTVGRSFNIAGLGPLKTAIASARANAIISTSSSAVPATVTWNISGVTFNNPSSISGTKGGGLDIKNTTSSPVVGATVNIYNTTFSGLMATTSGGGIEIEANSIANVTCSYCNFLNNQAVNGTANTYGGGIFVAGGNLTVSNSYFGGNLGYAAGGGIYVSPTAYSITGVTKISSTSGTFSASSLPVVGDTVTLYGFTTGANLSLDNAQVTVTAVGSGNFTGTLLNGATISATDTTDAGSAAETTTVIVNNSTFYNNTTTAGLTGGGAGIYMSSLEGSTVTLNNDTIVGNTTGYKGGGVNRGALTQLIINNSIVEDNAGLSYADIYSATPSGNGVITTTSSHANVGSGASSDKATLAAAGLLAPAQNSASVSETDAVPATYTSNLPLTAQVLPGGIASATGTSAAYAVTTDARGFLRRSAASIAPDQGALQSFPSYAVSTPTGTPKAGTPLAGVTAQLQVDNGGTTITTAPIGTVVTISDSLGAFVSGSTLTATTTSGDIATFSTTNLKPQYAGVSALTATSGSAATLISGTSANFTVAPAAVTHFSVTAATDTPVAGATTVFTVTALDGYNNVVTGYSGTITLTDVVTGFSSTVNTALSNGVEKFNVTANYAGQQTITASDGTYSGSDSAFSPTAGAGVSTTTVTGPTTTVSTTSNGAGNTTTTTLTATVTGAGATPTGLVNFYVGGSTLISGCTGITLSAGAVNCVATLTTLGANNITAVYVGDNNYASSTSAIFVEGLVVPQSVFIVSNTSGESAYTPTGGAESSYSGAGSYGAAVDSNGFVWSVSTGGTAYRYDQSGKIYGTYTPSGLTGGKALTVDGSGIVWVAQTAGSIYPIVASTGAGRSSIALATAGGINAPTAIAVDGAGSVWVANTGSTTITEVIGVASPTVSPAVTATTNNTQGTRP